MRPVSIQGKTWAVRYDAGAHTVAFSGVLRLRSARDYDEIKALLREALARCEAGLTLDISGVKMMNSSGLGMVGQFLVSARRTPSKPITLRSDADQPWQVRSMPTLIRIGRSARVEHVHTGATS